MSELLHNFGVDWKLLLAQAVNFGVLIFLLAKFAYRPILAMLKKRREDIEKGIRFTKDAEEQLSNADMMSERKIADARRNALVIVADAEQVAKVRKEEIAAEAARKSEEIVADARRLIGQEKAKMSEEVYGDAENLVRLGIARVLGKMPSEKRDEALIRDALMELKGVQS